MEYAGENKTDTTEVIDGNRYVECRFEKCKMIYRGGPIPQISGCHFENCTWHFEDAAERTLLFMRQLYHGMGAGGTGLIEATITMLRQPLPPDAEGEPPKAES
jgi:hypothetical protein